MQGSRGDMPVFLVQRCACGCSVAVHVELESKTCLRLCRIILNECLLKCAILFHHEDDLPLLILALCTNGPPETLTIGKAERPWQQPRQPQSATVSHRLLQL